MIKTFNLNFEGYWCERNKFNMPHRSGLYCVYACTYKPHNIVTIRKLLYIGQSEDVKQRLNNHEKLYAWNTNLRNEETLCYSYTSVASTDLNRCEATMIYKHKLELNEEYVYNFPFSETLIKLTGSTNSLSSSFTVYIIKIYATKNILTTVSKLLTTVVRIN